MRCLINSISFSPYCSHSQGVPYHSHIAGWSKPREVSLAVHTYKDENPVTKSRTDLEEVGYNGEIFLYQGRVIKLLPSQFYRAEMVTLYDSFCKAVKTTACGGEHSEFTGHFFKGCTQNSDDADWFQMGYVICNLIDAMKAPSSVITNDALKKFYQKIGIGLKALKSSREMMCNLPTTMDDKVFEFSYINRDKAMNFDPANYYFVSDLFIDAWSEIGANADMNKSISLLKDEDLHGADDQWCTVKNAFSKKEHFYSQTEKTAFSMWLMTLCKYAPVPKSLEALKCLTAQAQRNVKIGIVIAYGALLGSFLARHYPETWCYPGASCVYCVYQFMMDNFAVVLESFKTMKEPRQIPHCLIERMRTFMAYHIGCRNRTAYPRDSRGFPLYAFYQQSYQFFHKMPQFTKLYQIVFSQIGPEAVQDQPCAPVHGFCVVCRTSRVKSQRATTCTYCQRETEGEGLFEIERYL